MMTERDKEETKLRNTYRLEGVGGTGPIAVAFVFLLFWFASGWTRIDCAIGVPGACDTLTSQYKGPAR